MGIVLDHPLNRVAGQSGPYGQSGKVAIFQPAKSTRGGRPERSIPIESKVANPALTQPIGGCIRCTNLTVFEISHATVEKPKPQAASHRIGGQSRSKVIVSQLSP